MSFADHFSKHATDYAKYRPGYPRELFSWLQSLNSTHELAWDVGTGNGQAAVELAKNFSQVIATDPSAAQIKNALAHERVEYQVSSAEQCTLSDASVDLVTVAQALHWFDFDKFYAQVHRVLKPDGVIAAWTYTLNEIDAAVDTVVRHYYNDIVGQYWPVERRYIDACYRDIPFPFIEIAAPAIKMQTQWSLKDYLGYLRTWSASQHYQQAMHGDPVELIAQPLREAWGGSDAVRIVNWPIYIRAGKTRKKC